MRTRIEWLWEPLDDETSRSKVYGGWLICHKSSVKSESMVFMPDRDHVWNIMPPIVDEPKRKLSEDF
jgi:hypothetical protein